MAQAADRPILDAMLKNRDLTEDPDFPPHTDAREVAEHERDLRGTKDEDNILKLLIRGGLLEG